MVGVLADPRVPAVEAFAAWLTRTTAPALPVTGDPADVAAVQWATGEAGRRLAVLVQLLVGMHLPDVAGCCPDCRDGDGGCATWAVLADVLVGSESAVIDREYGRLLVAAGIVRPPQAAAPAATPPTPSRPADDRRADQRPAAGEHRPPERRCPWADERPAHPLAVGE